RPARAAPLPRAGRGLRVVPQRFRRTAVDVGNRLRPRIRARAGVGAGQFRSRRRGAAMSGAAGLFVTGTDTEIGKTVVAAALIRHLVAGGVRCAPMKPVASGAHMAGGALANEDALALIEAAGGGFEYGDVNPFVFADPVAPHIAAARGGTVIEFDV